MAAHSPSPSPVVSRKSQDSDLVVYAGEHRYELYKPDNETLIFSFPVPSGLTMKDLDFSCTGVSVSCRLKKSSAPPFLEGKLWSSLRPGADPPIITFEEQKSGRTLVIEFNISSGVQWPVLIGRPLNADAESIDPWSAYLLASVLERPSATMPANPIEAFAFFKNAARRGVAEAQYRLGQIYSNHIDAVMCGAGLDRRLAVTYFLAVAKVRSIGSHSQFTTAEIGEAQYQIGLAYEQGLGVTKHLETAIKWYVRASKNGNEDSIAKLNEAEDDLPSSHTPTPASASPSSSSSSSTTTPRSTAPVLEKIIPPSEPPVSWWNVALGTGAVILLGGLLYERFARSNVNE